MQTRTYLQSILPSMAFACISTFPLYAQQPAAISIDADQVLAPVNRLVFGHNAEAGDNAYIFSSNTTDLNLIQRGEGFWDPATGAPIPEAVKESKSVGMSMLRYPGGCLAHNFDWRKTVGPDAKKNGWLFGLDEYMALCNAIGALPLITVSDYALPVEQMPENAAKLVEYLNSPANPAHPWAIKRKQWGHPAPYNAEWFELGNETMHGNHRVVPHRQYSPEQYAEYVNTTAAAMRKVDPRIKIGVVMVPGPGTDVNSDWNRTVLHLAGASADFVIIHLYAPQHLPAGASESLRAQAMMAVPQHAEARLAQYHQLIRQQLGRDLPLAITEFNGAIDEPGDRLNFADALECADLLRVFLKPEMNVALANYFDFLNGPFGMLRTTVNSPGGEPMTEAPAFLLYRLWAQHFGSQLVKLQVQSPRAEFPGAGSEEPSTGSASEPRQQIQAFNLDQYISVAGTLWTKLVNVQIERQNSDFTIHLHQLSHSIYPTLAQIPRPAAEPNTSLEFSLSFDAQFIPDPGSDTAPMGVGLMDSRGWSQTHSGIGIDDITTTWKHFQGNYRLDGQTPSVNLTARLIADRKNISGTLQIRNLNVAAFIGAHGAGYPLLTSSASISSDRTRLFLIVFNKSASDSIPAAIHLAGFSAAKAQYWQVDGPGLTSTSGVTETVHGAPLPLIDGATANPVFPAHSMTAIEFTRPPAALHGAP